MNDITFRQTEPGDKNILLSLSRESIGMTDIFTYVTLHPELEQTSRLWLGENGGFVCVCYDDGSYITQNDLTTGQFIAARSVKGVSVFDTPKKKHRLEVMEYHRENIPPSENTVPLTGKDIISALRLMSGEEKLPDYLEKRYVDIVRGINTGLCDYIGIYENGGLVSCGGIVASNAKYALIGNIFTKKESRGKGLASDIVKTLVGNATERNLIPILYCEKNMSGFYHSIGFEEK